MMWTKTSFNLLQVLNNTDPSGNGIDANSTGNQFSTSDFNRFCVLQQKTLQLQFFTEDLKNLKIVLNDPSSWKKNLEIHTNELFIPSWTQMETRCIFNPNFLLTSKNWPKRLEIYQNWDCMWRGIFRLFVYRYSDLSQTIFCSAKYDVWFISHVLVFSDHPGFWWTS